jgi:hypothetical protein
MSSRRFAHVHRGLVPCAFAAALALCVGCGFGQGDGWKFAKWDMPRPFSKEEKKPDPEIPSRLATTWVETTLNRTGQRPQRGFGGRLAFFKSDSEDPVRVEGQLVVYAFDETDQDPYRTEPTRRYVFPAEQLSLYESQSKLGPTYSIWLPWDDAGGMQRKISLIARFEPKGGPIIVGEQTRHFLDGPAAQRVDAPQLAARESAEGVRAASYENETSSSTASQAMVAHARMRQAPTGSQFAWGDPGRLNTTTIPLPRKLASAPGAPLRQPMATPPMTADAASASVAPGANANATPTKTEEPPPVAAPTPTIHRSADPGAQARAAVFSRRQNAPTSALRQELLAPPRQAGPPAVGYSLGQRPALTTPSAR